MQSLADKESKSKSQPAAAISGEITDGKALAVEDPRPEAIAQRKLQETINNSPRMQQLRSYQQMANSSPRAQQLRTVQRMADGNSQPIQKMSMIAQAPAQEEVPQWQKDQIARDALAKTADLNNHDGGESDSQSDRSVSEEKGNDENDDNQEPAVASRRSSAPPTLFDHSVLTTLWEPMGTNRTLFKIPLPNKHHYSIECRTDEGSLRITAGHLTDENIPEGQEGRHKPMPKNDLNNYIKKAQEAQSKVNEKKAGQTAEHKNQKKAAKIQGEANETTESLDSEIRNIFLDKRLHQAINRDILSNAIALGWTKEQILKLARQLKEEFYSGNGNQPAQSDSKNKSKAVASNNAAPGPIAQLFEDKDDQE